MARYQFELRTASHVSDTLVVENVDLPALRIEVAKFVGELLRDHAKQIWEDKEWRVDVTDQTGLILYVLELNVTESAATMPLKK